MMAREPVRHVAVITAPSAAPQRARHDVHHLVSSVAVVFVIVLGTLNRSAGVAPTCTAVAGGRCSRRPVAAVAVNSTASR
jgi:hypothetical protein